MNRIHRRAQQATPLIAALLALGTVAVSPVAAQVAAVPQLINFQGRLATPTGNPVPNGTFSLRFSLHSAVSGAGNEVWNQTISNVTVSNGSFAVLLTGFPAGTFNNNLFLEIKVGSDVPLAPRQQLATVAYAFRADSVKDGAITTNALAASAVTAAKIANATITSNKFAAGIFNPLAWLLAGNSGTNAATQFLGTTDNQPLELRVNNVRGLRLTPLVTADFSAVNVLAGAPANSITVGVDVATIAGGGYTIGGVNRGNRVTDRFGTVGGGSLNVAGNGNADFTDAWNATVSGGESNQARGAGSFIGSGFGNIASGSYSVITGGFQNQTSGGIVSIPGGATVGGGRDNNASGSFATIPGGTDNSASGAFSFAAGQRASAIHQGAFVWADSQAATFASGLADQFSIRAAGGVRIVSDRDVTATLGSGILQIINSAGTLGLHLDNNEVQAIGGSLLINNSNVSSTLINGGTLRVTTDGRVGIGDSSPDFTLDVNGDINASGSVRSNGSALISDARYKQDISSFENALETILNLRGVTYHWNQKAFPDHNFGTGRQIGFIAQDVERILPELVMTDSKGYKSVAYQNVIPVLVEAVKTLNARTILQQKQIDALKSNQQENAAIKAKNAELEARLERLESALTRRSSSP